MDKRLAKLKALENQLARLHRRIEAFNKLSARYSWYRLAVFLAGVLASVSMAFIADGWMWLAIALTLILFNIVAAFHRRLDRSIARHTIWLDWKKSQLARMKLDWANIPAPLAASHASAHRLEIDLDIAGSKSLHHLMDISISENGSQRLREWLINEKPDLERIQRRQEILRELSGLASFRDRLLLNFRLVSRERLEDRKLLEWLQRGTASTALNRIIFITTALAIINFLLLFLYLIEMLPPFWLLSLGIYIFIHFANQRKTASLLNDADFLSAELKKYRAIFKYLESFNYEKTSHLSELCKPFLDKKNRPTSHLRRLTLVAIAIGLRMNFALGIILNALAPWDFYCALWLTKVRSGIAAHFRFWLDRCFELEALLSLANFAYLNPGYIYPVIRSGGASGQKRPFEAEALGHPLIPHDQKISNDVALQTIGEIMLITGSNMAGKSTFLRTIGINLCLAYTGAPVNADSLETSLFRVFTCIRINDSLSDGISQFYAEVKRLKELLTLLGDETDYPIFFLIDEIYKGTNNRERLIGSRSLIRVLAGKRGLGVISTHDLELAQLSDSIPKFTNFHFREDVSDGRMVFDYKLRPGPCPTTNALKIMQMEGLPVSMID
ncbi:hypothetical protein JXJ21_16650 [candidate division KSB1 bacterium]|nr:hypothetical protein [candidate division KSB1 bacterium]